jgi:uncharacterized membrane protein
MAKRKAKKAVRSSAEKEMWAGFTPTQLIIIFSVFLIFAIFYMM